MLRLRSIGRWLFICVVPPAIAGLIAHAAWTLSGGEGACLRTLDVNTAPIACMELIEVALTVVVAAVGQAIVLVALVWRAPVPAPGRRVRWLAAAILGVSALVAAYDARLGAGAVLGDAVGRVGLPAAVDLLLTVWLLRHGTVGAIAPAPAA
jgi:hypothetical protein